MGRYLKIGMASALLLSLALFSISKEPIPSFIEVEVKGVSIDTIGQNPVVILANKDGKKALPIWIGFLEANAIDKELKNVTSARPMTHDLLYSILGHVQAKVKEVKITNVKDHTYYAILSLIFNKGIIEVDARPSDAIIIALKSKVPILVSTKVIDEQGIALTMKNTFGERYGIRTQELTPSLASQFHFKGPKGVLVSEVVSGSPSEASGIKAGDIITKVNLKEVKNIQEFEEAFDALKGVGSIRISIFRDDKFSEINLSIKP